MRTLLICIFFLTALGCAGPQIVERQFAPEKTLHMSQVGEVKDIASLDQYIFFLNQGDTLPLKLQSDCSLIELAEDHVNIVLKRKIFFRVELTPEASQKDIEKLLDMTPARMAALSPKELRELLKKVKFFISTDGGSWALLTDKKGVKEILGFQKGQLSLGMAFTKEEGMWFLFSLKMREQQKG